MKPKARKVVGYGYVGEWNDGSLGWFLPRHLSHRNKKNSPEQPHETFYTMVGEYGVKCKITIEEIPNQRRRKCYHE